MYKNRIGMVLVEIYIFFKRIDLDFSCNKILQIRNMWVEGEFITY